MFRQTAELPGKALEAATVSVMVDNLLSGAQTISKTSFYLDRCNWQKRRKRLEPKSRVMKKAFILSSFRILFIRIELDLDCKVQESN